MKKFYNKELKSAGCPVKRGMTECGRSMVEMLGVLAVIGVLSVAGIAGYKNAMNKHRANTLLNEASKRAVNVVAQISMMGKDADNASLSEFTDPTGYTFGVAKRNANQFNITIDSVSDDICAQMKATAGKDTPIRKINDTCTELTFNNDLSTTVYASDFETESACQTAGKTWCVGGISCSDGDCCAGKVVGECQRCDSTGATLITAAEGETCNYTTEGDGICHNGTCIPKSTEANCVAGGVRCNDTAHGYGECCPVGYMCTTNGDIPGVCTKLDTECTTNDDCTGSNQYCNLSPDTNNSCISIKRGVCKPWGTPVPATISGLGNVIASPDNMNWWSAKNWCEAQGKHLINIEDFQVYYTEDTNTPGGTLVTANNAASYGCARGKTCNRWDGNGMWKGTRGTDARTLTSAGETLQANYSPVLVALAKEFRGNKWTFWTASDYNTCIPLTVLLETGTVRLTGGAYVPSLNRDKTPNNYALCK